MKPLSSGRVLLRPLDELDAHAWRRVHAHFRDRDIAHLNGTPPSRMPLWLLKRILRADSRRSDRQSYGIFDEIGDYIGTIELYDIGAAAATLGIIIGERSHWGRGYGPEAIAALLQHAFETMRLSRVRLSTFGDNARAQLAFKKVGFAERRRYTNRAGRIDVEMDISAEAWLERRSRPPAPAEAVPGAPGGVSLEP
ncbi:MAG: GNAT family N-acetyltransferase [Deinococcota bacterium]|jgi:RimJ/RimL family protein N-acetyltransferase|nr:GNAT family N-acetyltransferase [Deinococcota bacterium]